MKAILWAHTDAPFGGLSMNGFPAPALFGLAVRLEKEGFLDRVTRLGIRPTLGTTLTLEWDMWLGSAQIAAISADGTIATDVEIGSLPEAREAAHAYVERLAAGWGMALDRSVTFPVWSVRAPRGGEPKIDAVRDRLDIWIDALAELAGRLSRR